jgi:hypothetical protein
VLQNGDGAKSKLRLFGMQESGTEAWSIQNPTGRPLLRRASVTLKVLHDVIQASMGWSDYHLWDFTIEGRNYSLPMYSDGEIEPRCDAGKVRLRDVLAPATTTIDDVYDFV